MYVLHLHFSYGTPAAPHTPRYFYWKNEWTFRFYAIQGNNYEFINIHNDAGDGDTLNENISDYFWKCTILGIHLTKYTTCLFLYSCCCWHCVARGKATKVSWTSAGIRNECDIWNVCKLLNHNINVGFSWKERGKGAWCG